MYSMSTIRGGGARARTAPTGDQPQVSRLVLDYCVQVDDER